MKKEEKLDFNQSRKRKKSSSDFLLRYFTFFVLFAFLNLSIGCTNYYRVNTIRTNYSEETESMRLQNKLFILDDGTDRYWLNFIRINDDNTGIYAKINPFPDQIEKAFNAIDRHTHRYKDSEKNILQQVHIHASKYTKIEDSEVFIPFTSISSMKIYNTDWARTAGSWTLSFIGGALLAIAVLYLIILLTKSSCPFIYTFDGERYVFTGEIFSGATKPGLERFDYLYLPHLKPSDDEYRLKVTNEIREIQYINLIQLKVIDHPDSKIVLMDKTGELQTIAYPVTPKSATTYTGRCILSKITEKDNLIYAFDDVAYTQQKTDGIILSWDKPDNTNQAKLIIRAKNSFWIEHVFANFHEMFGGTYEAFERRQEKKSPEFHYNWIIDQSLPLLVHLEKDGEWELYDFFQIAGPMAMRDDVLEIKLIGIESETINVKLETGFMFWEIDYVAMDFTDNVPLEVTTISLSEAIDEKGNDVSMKLLNDDKSYYIQPEIGNEASLVFPVPEFTDESRTVILESKGYYKILREQKGWPKIKELRTFRNPGRMPLFSKELYDRMILLTQEE